MATFRQMQRWLRLSMKAPKKAFGHEAGAEIYDLTYFLSGRGNNLDEGMDSAVFKNGRVANVCDCRECRIIAQKFEGLLGQEDLARLLDALARKYGAETDVAEWLSTLRRGRRPEQGQPGQGQPGQGQPGQGQPGQGQPGQGQPGQGQPGQGEPDDAVEALSAALRARDDAPQTEKSATTATQAAQEQAERAADRQRAAAEQVKNLQAKLKDAAEDPQAARAYRSALKRAKRAASQVARNSRPSLKARRGVSRGVGRLRRVDVKTRQRMVALINRILGKGATGDQLTPIPVTDFRRLTKRMLSKRSLVNAFKEDSDCGRPSILFLPDISPSCAAQAQAACDIANAAGYAGVPGADVLVMPHFNGDIDSSCEEYMPWRNGRPMTLTRTEQAQLFADATTGRRFNVRAVVIIGDHDGAHLYSQMAEQPKFRHIIWLHNWTNRSEVGPVLLGSAHKTLWAWPKSNIKTLRVVLGCTTAEHMMTGLERAT